MKNLLITTTTFPLNEEDAQPGFIYSLAKVLVDDFNVTVLAPRGKSSKEQESLGKIDVRRYSYFFSKFETLVYGGGILENLRANHFKYLLIPFLLIAQFICVWREVRNKNIDVINAQWIIPQGLIAILVNIFKRKKIKVVVTSHGGDLYGLQRLNSVKRWILNKSDAVIVVSSAMKHYCYDVLKIERDKPVYVRSMGVDLISTFMPTSTVEQREGLIFVGRVAEKKGLSVLIDALAILHTRGFELTLCIVGEGDDLRNIQHQVEAHKLTKYIRFMGRVKNTEIPIILNKHAVFIMPSVIASDGDQEGLGLVAVEAMGCGCTVIATDLETIRDVVKPGITGFLFEAGDSAALAKQIKLVYSDIKLRAHYAESSRRFVLDNFDWLKVAGEYSNILNS